MSVLGIVGLIAVGAIVGAVGSIFGYRNNRKEVDVYADKVDDIYEMLEEAIEKRKN